MMIISPTTQIMIMSPARTIPYLRFSAKVKPLQRPVSIHDRGRSHSEGASLQEAVHDSNENDSSSEPNVNNTVLGSSSSLFVIPMIEETNGELNEEEGDKNHAQYLVIGIKVARLGFDVSFFFGQ